MGASVKIVSGGQTGVDRAALDVALELGLPVGGWCPKGRRAEDGVIDKRYPLEETPHWRYQQRTEWNVRDSAGTLIICGSALSTGTQLTKDFARRYKREAFVYDIEGFLQMEAAQDWLQRLCGESEADGPVRLNVAGPRETTQPGIYDEASAILRELLGALAEAS